MAPLLARYWWAVALRGLIAVLFGFAAFVWPGITIEVLILLFGAYVLVDGVITAVAAVRSRAQETHWWALLLEGIAGILAGLIALVLPGVAAFALIYLIAAWALVTGLLEIAAAIGLRREIEGEWRMVLSGVASVIFGILVAVWPAAGALAIVFLIGIYAVIFGVLLLALAFRLRKEAPEAPASGAA